MVITNLINFCFSATLDTFAMLGAAITLIIPLVVRYITNEVIYYDGGQALKTILALGGLMVVLVLVEMGCNYYI